MTHNPTSKVISIFISEFTKEFRSVTQITRIYVECSKNCKLSDHIDLFPCWNSSTLTLAKWDCRFIILFTEKMLSKQWELLLLKQNLHWLKVPELWKDKIIYTFKICFIQGKPNLQQSYMNSSMTTVYSSTTLTNF